MKCMCAQTRPRFILSSERVLGGMEFEPMLTPKIPSTRKCPQRSIEPATLWQRAQALPTELFRPRYALLKSNMPKENSTHTAFAQTSANQTTFTNKRQFAQTSANQTTFTNKRQFAQTSANQTTSTNKRQASQTTFTNKRQFAQTSTN